MTRLRGLGRALRDLDATLRGAPVEGVTTPLPRAPGRGVGGATHDLPPVDGPMAVAPDRRVTPVLALPDGSIVNPAEVWLQDPAREHGVLTTLFVLMVNGLTRQEAVKIMCPDQSAEREPTGSTREDPRLVSARAIAGEMKGITINKLALALQGEFDGLKIGAAKYWARKVIEERRGK